MVCLAPLVLLAGHLVLAAPRLPEQVARRTAVERSIAAGLVAGARDRLRRIAR